MARTSRSEHARPGGPRARMFVALDLPDDFRGRLADWRDAATTGRDDLRPVPAESLHVTLIFLGWQAETDAQEIAVTAFGAAEGQGAPVLTAAGVRPLPPRSPRLFALDLEDEGGRAARVQAEMGAALASAGHWQPEKRPWWPHVTLARVKRGRRARPLEASSPPADPFAARRITLYRSVLLPQGARYEVIASAELGPAR